MNTTAIVIIGAAVIALIVFLIIRNQKDEAEYEHDLNNDYPKPKNLEGDIETE